MIVKDPKIMCGKPTIKGTRITALCMYSQYLGGDSVDWLSSAYGLTKLEVIEAIKYFEKT